ncbi:hypothetical protein DPMN_144083 [Dreissena polymorpha]|uniref:Uncharacterized protein n=1 Tax=Dreissena polymorpha TaxID=45954 RepID=A0A9D4JKM4_DREPO|nr:hypothetical protein DPMN_144083 [Dreissena polymorpha]
MRIDLGQKMTPIEIGVNRDNGDGGGSDDDEEEEDNDDDYGDDDYDYIFPLTKNVKVVKLQTRLPRNTEQRECTAVLMQGDGKLQRARHGMVLRKGGLEG